MKLIVGLGNPGKEYKNTRHNVGFDVVDEYLKKYNQNVNKSKFEGMYSELIINGEKSNIFGTTKIYEFIWRSS